ncbi:MAG: GMC family oxidoreductase [Flavobacteriales bacterium]|nr:GMC family oxidoreductase [Flavobacteriales bacterium]
MQDFIVVGSGSSGGILARILTEGGAKVTLIEAGKFYRKNTFPKTEAAYSSQMFWGGGLEFDDKAKSAYLRAKCVGGTSNVNQCLMNRFDDLAFDDWRDRSGVDWLTLDTFKEHYEGMESLMELHTFDKSDFNRNAHLFTDACDKIEYGWKYLRRGQKDCKIEEGNDCIGCLGGCQRDSKQSTLVIGVQVAEKLGLEVLSEFEAETVVHHEDHVVLQGVHEGEKKELSAKRMILAGGSFGTTKILLNSGFKKQLPSLGKGFCQHPQYMAFGIFDEPVDSHKGAFQTVASEDPKMRSAGFKLENVYAPPIAIGMLFNSYGREHQRLMKKYRYMACIEAAVRDQPEGGEIDVDKKGNLVIRKTLTEQDLVRADKGIEAINNVFAAAGAKEVIDSPFYFGLHLMGGCSFGVDPQKSVINPDYQVHGHKNIYVSDSSVFPSAPGINPALTMMTMSKRLGEQLLKS